MVNSKIKLGNHPPHFGFIFILNAPLRNIVFVLYWSWNKFNRIVMGREHNNSTTTNMDKQLFFWFLVDSQKNQVNDLMKVYAILTLELDKFRENSKETGTLKKMSNHKKASQQFNTKIHDHTSFFLVKGPDHFKKCPFAKRQVNNSTRKYITTLLFFSKRTGTL